MGKKYNVCLDSMFVCHLVHFPQFPNLISISRKWLRNNLDIFTIFFTLLFAIANLFLLISIDKMIKLFLTSVCVSLHYVSYVCSCCSLSFKSQLCFNYSEEKIKCTR